MTSDLLEDFREDVAEGDLVTLLLSDKTQEVGIVKKIRTSNLKIEILDSKALVIIQFDDIQRYALGSYDFIDRKPSSATPVPAAVVSAPSAARVSLPSPAQTISSPSGEELQIQFLHKQITSECSYATFSWKIEPVFEFEIKSQMASVQKAIKDFRNTVKNKCEYAIKQKELSRLQGVILQLKDYTRTYPGEGGLHALLGALLWLMDDKKNALPALQAAARHINSARAWLDLACASSDDPLAAYFALKNYFGTGSPEDWKPDLLILLCKYGQKAGCLAETISILLGVASKSPSPYADTLKKLLQAIVFALKEEKLDNEARLVFDLLSQNADLVQAAAKAKAALGHVAPRRSEQYDSWEKNNLPPLPQAYVIQAASVPHTDPVKRPSTVVYSTDHGYSDSYQYKTEQKSSYATGIVVEYALKNVNGSSVWAGNIMGDDGNVYFFIAPHIDDDDLDEAFKKRDFSQRVGFKPFVNSRGILQAGWVKKNNAPFPLGKSTGTFLPGTHTSTAANVRQQAEMMVRVGNKEGAVAMLFDALKQFNNDIDLNLLLAQQLSSLGRSKEAAEAYRHLLEIEHRPGAKKNAHVQYALLLGKAGEQEKALQEVDKLLRSYPNDALLQNLPDKIRQYGQDVDSEDDEQLDIWDDIDTMGVPQLLKKELENAEFFDETIVSRGGRPTPEDAERLNREAMSMTKDSQGYFRFLEAAKAYSLLPVGTFLYDDYKDCLCRYAMQKGGVLVSRMNGLASTPEQAQKNADTISKLNDSATCYFIEGLSLLGRDYAKDVAPAVIRNYLRSLLFKFFSLNPKKYNSSLLNQDMNSMLKSMLIPAEEELFTIACDALLTWGSYPDVWNTLKRVKGGPGVFTDKLREIAFRTTVKKTFTKLTGYDHEAATGKDLLKGYFQFMQKERESLGASFRALHHIRKTKTFEYFRLLDANLQRFPRENKALQISDRRMLDKLALVLKNMMTYRSASDEERTDILVRARQGVLDKSGQPLFPGFNNLQGEIAEMPTYWQLVGCKDLINNCLDNVNEMEQARTKSRLPQLKFILDPPVFRENGDAISTSLRIDNIGTSANKVDVVLSVEDGQKNRIFRMEGCLEKIPSKESGSIQVAIPQDVFSRAGESAQLVINASYMEGSAEECRFTIDKDKGSHFLESDIPWRFTNAATPETFKGREDIIAPLVSALNSKHGRSFSYILYGVTRSGKTSILEALKKRVHGTFMQDESRRFLCIEWNFGDFSNYSSEEALWNEILHSSFANAVKGWDVPEDLRQKVLNSLPVRPHGEDFTTLMKTLRELGVFPVVLIDEFTYFREMYDKQLLSAGFLSVVRELALGDYATFIVAGTYGLLAMTRDSHYGITGQFVNSVRKHVTSLDSASARELVNIFSEHLTFTKDACDYILKITDCRPYLIQMFCYHCAIFACKTERSILGMPEIQTVEKMLCVKPETSAEEIFGVDGEKIDIPVIGEDRFDKNHIFQDEDHWLAYAAIISILAFRGTQENGFLTYDQIKSIWGENDLDISLLPVLLQELSERYVITEAKDEGDDGYQLKVGLFRKWWKEQDHTLEKDLDAAFKVVPAKNGR